MYWLDYDTKDGSFPTAKYACDMQTDGGGWTLVAAVRADLSPKNPLISANPPPASTVNLATQANGDVTQSSWVKPSVWDGLLKHSQGDYELLVETGTGLYKVQMAKGLAAVTQWMQLTTNSSNSKGAKVHQIWRADLARRPNSCLETPNSCGTAGAKIAWTPLGTRTFKPCVQGADNCPHVPWAADGPFATAHRKNAAAAAGFDGLIPHFSRIWVR